MFAQAKRILMILVGLIGGGGAAAFGIFASLDSYNSAGLGETYTIYYGPAISGVLIFLFVGLVPLILLLQERASRPSAKKKSAPAQAFAETKTQQAPVQPQASAAAQSADQSSPQAAGDAERRQQLATLGVRVMAAAAAADGKLHQNEINIIVHAAAQELNASVNPETVQGYVSHMASDENILANDLLTNKAALSALERSALYKCAVLVSYADGNLDETEKHLVARVGDILEIATEQRTALAQAAFQEIQQLFLKAKAGE